jgi:starch synthase
MTSLIPLYLKTIYKDEPVFRLAKVVYSVFENQFEENMGKEFGRKASLNAIDNKQISALANATCSDLYMSGITHADALVKASSEIHPEVTKFIKKQKGKPVIEHSENGDNVDAYIDLYDTLLQGQN